MISLSCVFFIAYKLTGFPLNLPFYFCSFGFPFFALSASLTCFLSFILKRCAENGSSVTLRNRSSIIDYETNEFYINYLEYELSMRNLDLNKLWDPTFT